MGLAVVRSVGTRHRLDSRDERSDFQEHLVAEYVFSRSAQGLADSTIASEVRAIEEFREFLDSEDVWLWEAQAGHGDRFLGGLLRRQSTSTKRNKAGAIDCFYEFLAVRFAGEIRALTGLDVQSPIDEMNRPVHSGDFSVRIPPSGEQCRRFFAGWRDSLPKHRKYLTAARNYTMARVTYEVGFRSNELRSLSLDDLHWDHGPLGKVHIRMGKGSRGSGPRERLVPMLGDSRSLLQWWVEQVRGEFSDDWSLPGAMLFPSERGGHVRAESYRSGLAAAVSAHHRAGARTITPHVLRHACASTLYSSGMGLMAIQRLLGHRWLATTMGYVHVAEESIERDYLAAAERAAAKLSGGAFK